ncbi:MAG: carboxypeptidase-like regulatory domain-containing protein, partial [bacterium]
MLIPLSRKLGLFTTGVYKLYKLPFCFAFTCVLSLAQTTLGTITGRVTDPSDAAIVAASVKATNTGTRLEFRTATTSAGTYVLPQLPIGSYELTVEASGFRKALRKGIELNVAQTLNLDVRLEVGAVDQTVEVTGEIPALQTATS